MPVLTAPRTRFRKVHVTLPPDVHEELMRRSQEAGAPFSTTLTDAVRRGLEAESQERLEQALELDRQANAAFAAEVGPVSARVLGRAAMSDKKQTR